MSRQEAETGSPASEYLTVPELAKMVRRNRKDGIWLDCDGRK